MSKKEPATLDDINEKLIDMDMTLIALNNNLSSLQSSVNQIIDYLSSDEDDN